MNTDKRKMLVEQYKQIKVYMGVIQIQNKINNKIYINSYSNLKNKWITLQMQLNQGRFANAQLQKEWNEFEEETFTYTVLEQKEADTIADMRWEKKRILKGWFEKLQPYGDEGYHKLIEDE